MRLAAAVALLPWGAAAYAAEPSSLTLSLGLDYSTGDYGRETKTNIWYLPISIKYQKEKFALALTVPYLRIEGPATGVSAGDSLIIAKGGVTTRSGLGDIVAAATYNLVPGYGSWPLIDLTLKMKLATADETKGLGTGENDYAWQSDLAKAFGRLVVFGTVGRKYLGDPPGIEFNDIWYFSLGGGYKWDTNLTTGLIYDYREASISGNAQPREAVAYFSKKIDDKRKILGYLVKGFTDGSPAWGIGGSISFAL
ncbi:MAG TPA: hypothetical protein VK138_10380 [Acidiferrobacterales bacterium]|nr:hypothetical protein [Acidiferrobacterales bacterium]